MTQPANIPLNLRLTRLTERLEAQCSQWWQFLLGTLRVTQNWHWSETRVSTRLLKIPALKDRIHGFLFRAQCTLKHNSVRKKKKKRKKPKNGVSHLCSLHPHFDVHEIRIKNLDQDKRAAPKIVLYCFYFFVLFCFFFFYYLEGGDVRGEWGGEEDLGTEKDSKLFSFSSALLLWGGLQRTEGISSWGVTFLRPL